MQKNLQLVLDDNTEVLVVSDIHLRLPVTRELEIIEKSLVERIESLNKHRRAILVLNGDILELWEQTGQSVADIISGFERLTDTIQKFKAGKGHRVVYVVGNHDDLLFHSPTDRAVVESKWGADFTMQLELGLGKKWIVFQHGHQYDPYNKPNGSKAPHGKKIVQSLLPFFNKNMPLLFKNIGDVNEPSLFVTFIISNFIYNIFVPLVAPILIGLAFAGSLFWHDWSVMVATLLIVVATILMSILASLITRLFSNLILGGGEVYLKKVDKKGSKKGVWAVALGHTHQGGVFKRQGYTYANSGCNDIVASKSPGWLGIPKFQRSLYLGNLIINKSKKPVIAYYLQTVPLVE